MTDGSTPRAVVEEIYAAFEADDVARIRGLLAADLRWRQAGQAVPAAGEDAHGAEAFVERVIEPLRAEWENFTEKVDELLVADEVVIATGTYRATHRATGGALVAEFCHHWVVRDGLVRGFRQYTDTAAFAAVQRRNPTSHSGG